MGQKHSINLPALISLTNPTDPAVKYFSGSATYSKKFEISELKPPIDPDLGQGHDQLRPEQNRKYYVTWYYHRKDTALLPAGLIGPVTLVPQSTF